jgi:hypothetical protein
MNNVLFRSVGNSGHGTPGTGLKAAATTNTVIMNGTVAKFLKQASNVVEIE